MVSNAKICLDVVISTEVSIVGAIHSPAWKQWLPLCNHICVTCLIIRLNLDVIPGYDYRLSYISTSELFYILTELLIPKTV